MALGNDAELALLFWLLLGWLLVVAVVLAAVSGNESGCGIVDGDVPKSSKNDGNCCDCVMPCCCVGCCCDCGCCVIAAIVCVNDSDDDLALGDGFLKLCIGVMGDDVADGGSECETNVFSTDPLGVLVDGRDEEPKSWRKLGNGVVAAGVLVLLDGVVLDDMSGGDGDIDESFASDAGLSLFSLSFLRERLLSNTLGFVSPSLGLGENGLGC